MKSKKLLLIVVASLALSACPQTTAPPKLTDAQKYQALQFEFEIMQIQATYRDLQTRVQAFSDQACGKDYNLIYQNEGKEVIPTCQSKTPPVAATPPAKAPEQPKKP